MIGIVVGVSFFIGSMSGTILWDYLEHKHKAKHYAHGVPKSSIATPTSESLHTAEELTRLEFAIADSPKPLRNGALIKYADDVYYVTINTDTVKDFNDIIKEVRKQQSRQSIVMGR